MKNKYIWLTFVLCLTALVIWLVLGNRPLKNLDQKNITSIEITSFPSKEKASITDHENIYYAINGLSILTVYTRSFKTGNNEDYIAFEITEDTGAVQSIKIAPPYVCIDDKWFLTKSEECKLIDTLGRQLLSEFNKKENKLIKKDGNKND